VKKWLFSLVLFAGLCALPGLAAATPFSYSEAISGDLDYLPVSAFAFDSGTNTVAGSTRFTVGFPGTPHFDADFDNFAFSLPVAMTLDAITLDFLTTPINASKADIELQLCTGISDCFTGVLGTQDADLLGPSPLNVDFGGAIPLTAGIYTLHMHGIGIAPVDPTQLEGWFADYVWSFHVVPESNSIALAGLGFILIFFTRRRQPLPGY
jgi:hypothetical protein